MNPLQRRKIFHRNIPARRRWVGAMTPKRRFATDKKVRVGPPLGTSEDGGPRANLSAVEPCDNHLGRRQR
jgi:hypothetical protein